MADHEALNNVRRKINEVMKKTDERIVVGWRPSLAQKREEGETWVDEVGKTWIMKDGIKRNITLLDGARTPLFCPTCEKIMNHRLDTKYWRIRGKCMDCVVADETEMRRLGKWKEYEQEIIRANYIAELKDNIAELRDLHDTVSAPEVVLADDTRILMIEKWHVDIDKVKADIMDDIVYLEEQLAKIEAGEYDNLSTEENT
jgi:hypothetical protein